MTSIGSEHHRSLGTLEATRDEKARMLDGLRPGGIAVLNRDDPEVMAMVPPAGTRILTFGFDPPPTCAPATCGSTGRAARG